MSTLKNPVTQADHVQGDIKAPVILVEYGDYQCPHCGHAYPIVKQVQKHFGGRLCFVFRNFPLKEVHAHAEAAAETAEFAAAQGRFWEMHDALFENQDDLELPELLELAQDLQLPAAGLEESLRDGTYASRVQHDFMGGVRSGVNGTPTFFINNHRHDGPFEFEDLVGAIDARIAGPEMRR
jgi:protein-disulfide isomerase